MAGLKRRPFRYVHLLMAAFDRDQVPASLRRDDAPAQLMEGIMTKITSRAAARVKVLNREDLASEWTIALWLLAAAFLVATFQIY